MISDKKIVFVLGMHRSGTSCLTGILKERGCALGNFKSQISKSNEKGNQENPAIYRLNERILKINGASWFKPKNKTLEISDRIAEKIKSLKKELLNSSEANLFLIKDPRMIFCLPFWIDNNSILVGTIRHPNEVVQSLKKRNENAEIKLTTNWLWLWLQYNKSLLALFKQYNFPIVNFSSDLNTYGRSVNEICKTHLQIKFKDEELPFLNNNLKHHSITNEAIQNAEAKALYDTLSAIADNLII